jgi:hypothetical protein
VKTATARKNAAKAPAKRAPARKRTSQ